MSDDRLFIEDLPDTIAGRTPGEATTLALGEEGDEADATTQALGEEGDDTSDWESGEHDFRTTLTDDLHTVDEEDLSARDMGDDDTSYGLG